MIKRLQDGEKFITVRNPSLFWSVFSILNEFDLCIDNLSSFYSFKSCFYAKKRTNKGPQIQINPTF